MSTQPVQFRCPHCRARIKAPARLIGQTRACPNCNLSFAVPRTLPEDCGPVLVPVEQREGYRLVFGGRHSVYAGFAAVSA